MIHNPIIGFFAVIVTNPKTLRTELIGQYGSRKVAAITARQYNGLVVLSEDMPAYMESKQKELDRQFFSLIG